MNICKFCNSRRLVKDGKVREKQRYRCKDCCRAQVDGDGRVKYENKIKKSAVILYLEGNGMRAIARILSEIFETRIYFQTIAKWLKQAGQIVEEEVRNMQTADKAIDIIEMDGLFAYIENNKIRSEYGLLLTGTNSVYLNLKSVVQKSRHG